MGSCELSGKAYKMLGVIHSHPGGGEGAIMFLLRKPKPNTSLMDHKAPD